MTKKNNGYKTRFDVGYGQGTGVGKGTRAKALKHLKNEDLTLKERQYWEGQLRWAEDFLRKLNCPRKEWDDIDGLAV